MATILQITPHRIFPPRGGRRAFFYQRELAREHEVHVLLPQSKSDMDGVKEGYTMPSSNVIHSTLDEPAPKTVFSMLPPRVGPALHHRWLRRSLRGGPASGELLSSWHLLKRVLREQPVDIVIFDHIQTLSMASLVERLSPRAVRMLNAHNVDHVLYERLAENASGDERLRLLARGDLAKRIEANLADYVHGYWACSEEDHEMLKRLNGDRVFGYAIPNGIATEVLPFDDRPGKQGDRKILFCGSLNYEPNRRGLDWFKDGPWPLIKERLPDARLVVIGYGAKPTDFAELRADPAVDFVGEVDEVSPWYHKCSVSVVPILEGSGTRVKILEAMTLGNPVIATTIGAEGIKATDGRDILLRDDPGGFADGVADALTDNSLYGRLREGGRKLVEEVYDWRVVGDALNRTIPDTLTRAGG